jgi:hypothetical protein
MVQLTDFTFAVEMATGSTPRTASPSYTAITSYVMAGEGITLSRGRGSEQDSTAQPGRASVALRNTDNRFTMGNGSSPYAPLQLRRPCRFRVTYSATTYDRWQGFVDDWGNRRSDLTGVARLSLSDRLARAGKVTLKSALVQAMLADGALAVFPFDDTAGSPAAVDASGSGASLAVGFVGSTATASVTFGVEGAPGPDDSTKVAFTPQDAFSGYQLAGDASALTSIGTSNRTIECWITVPTTQAWAQTVWDLASSSLAVNTDGTLTASNLLITTTTTATVTDGLTHHVVVTQSVSGGNVTIKIYIDGVQASSNLVAGSLGTATAAVLVGGGNLGGARFSGSISHLGVYLGVLSDPTILDHYGAGASWSPETTTARFNRLCADAGLPSAFYATSGTTDTTMGPQPTAGRTLLDVLGECAAVEGGVLYVSDTGVLTLATSGSRYNTSVGLTLDSTKAGQVVSDVELVTNDGLLINDSSAARNDGPVQRTIDATSVANYDTQSESVTLPFALDVIALNWTQWRVGQFDTPAPRLESVTVNVVGYANSGGNVANLLNAEIGTKVQITNLPTDVSSSSTLTLMIEGVRDEWRKDDYLITFTTSPIGLNDTVWILGTDLLGVGTVLGY